MGKLAEAIKAGKNPKGMKGYVKVSVGGYNSHTCYAPAVIRGVTVDGCNIKIAATLAGGIGEIPISPCQLLDDLKAVKEQERIVKGKEKAKEEEHAIDRWTTIAGRRRQLKHYVDKLKASQTKRFWLEMADQGCTDILHLDSGLLSKMTEIATQEANGVLESPEIDDDDF